jgi:nicotinamidase-related amidase
LLKIDPKHLFENSEATALLIVDMQHDFVDPSAPLSTPGATTIIPTIASIADACRNRRLPVIYTREMHRAGLEDFGIEGNFEPLHCVEGTGGSEIVPELEPRSGDYVVAAKRRYDAFLGTELDLLLRGLKVENLLVTGVCTDICVVSTVFHARNLDYRCFVVTDAVDGTSQQRHDAALLCLSHVWAFLGTSYDAAELFKLDLVR